MSAINSYRYFPDIRSAAFKNIAARSAKVMNSHAGLAVKADSMALETSAEVALVYLATGSRCEAGLGWVKDGVSHSFWGVSQRSSQFVGFSPSVENLWYDCVF